MKTLIDTNVLAAFANEHDSLHDRAVRLKPHIGKPVVTDYVFDELTNIITRRVNKRSAIMFCQGLLEDITIERIDGDDFMHAWELFKKHKHLSFTDCTNIAVMQSLGITQIATFDRAFADVPDITVIS